MTKTIGDMISAEAAEELRARINEKADYFKVMRSSLNGWPQRRPEMDQPDPYIIALHAPQSNTVGRFLCDCIRRSSPAADALSFLKIHSPAEHARWVAMAAWSRPKKRNQSHANHRRQDKE